ncbi:MAG: hypothetical protein EHM45_20190 [Desulfobacteraceae bacterium]|nr:MAG: hypothetical protein EHM45_20190 [Desulfobacteraceae bacterium]
MSHDPEIKEQPVKNQVQSCFCPCEVRKKVSCGKVDLVNLGLEICIQVDVTVYTISPVGIEVNKKGNNIN